MRSGLSPGGELRVGADQKKNISSKEKNNDNDNDNDMDNDKDNDKDDR